MEAESRKFFIIDGHSYSYQAYYAMSQLQTPSGLFVGAVFGFTQLVERILREKATHLAVVFDSPAATFRSERYQDYKIHRAPMPEELGSQIDLIKEVMAAYRIPVIEVPGYEADDAIATLAKRAARDGIRTFIISKDKDLEQLLDEHICIWNPKDGECLDVAGLYEKKGLRPEQVIDYLAIVGDASDNVPGIEGIGAKTAMKILAAVDRLEKAWEGEIPGLSAKVLEKLRTGRESAELSRELVTLELNCSIPEGCEPEVYLVKPPDREALQALFKRFHFRRLLEAYSGQAAEGMEPIGTTIGTVRTAAPPGRTADPFPAAAAWTPGGQGDIPGLLNAAIQPVNGTASSPPAPPEAAAPAPAPWKPLPSKYSLVLTREELADLAARLAASKGFALDTETTGFDPFHDELVGLSFAVFKQPPPDSVTSDFRLPTSDFSGEPTVDSRLLAKSVEVEAFYVPLKAPEPLALSAGEVLEALRPAIEDPRIPKTGQNIKFDLLFYRNAGLHPRGVEFDTLLASYLLNPEVRSHNLDSLALEYLDHRKIPIESLLGRGKGQIGMAQAPLPAIRDYACEDADVTLRLEAALTALIREAGLEPLLRDVEMPLLEVLADMELAGVALDQAHLFSMSGRIRATLADLTREIHQLAGREFNISIPIQLGLILYGELGLPAGPRGKSGNASTAAEVLLALRDRHPIVARILEHRELTKLLTTYIDALPALVKPRTGRIHTSFNQTVAATGRLSSSDPNLQNIPIKTELGREIRKAFISGDPERVLLAADYSQVELRILAHLSRDQVLIAAFQNGEDIHQAVAAQIYGVRPAEVTSAMRRFAKTVNFGIIYGMTPFGLSQDLGIPVEDATEIIRSYFERHAGVRAFVDEVVGRARESGFVRTILGRRRPIRDLNSRNSRLRSLGERMAVNSVVQGSAADLIKVAMNNIHTDLAERGSGARLLLQIHDELVLEVPRASLAIEERRVREEMMGAMALAVPIEVNMVSGETWFEAK